MGRFFLYFHKVGVNPIKKRPKPVRKKQLKQLLKRKDKRLKARRAVARLAQATIAGIETAHMIRNGQLSEENMPAYKQFMALAG